MTLWDKKRKRIPEEWREIYLRHRSPEEIRRDLVEAFDRIEAMKLKLWILGAAVAAEGAIIGWLATGLLDCIQNAHRMAAVIR
jgi:hypothetical protein